MNLSCGSYDMMGLGYVKPPVRVSMPPSCIGCGSCRSRAAGKWLKDRRPERASLSGDAAPYLVGPGRDPLVGLVPFVDVVDGEPHEVAVHCRYGGVVGIVRVGYEPDEFALAVLQVFVKDTHAVAEGVGVGFRIAAAEEGYRFAGEVHLLQRLDGVVPVVLQFAVSPGGGAQYQDVVGACQVCGESECAVQVTATEGSLVCGKIFFI